MKYFAFTLSLTCLLIAASAHAEDCQWSNLSPAEQQTLLVKGEPVLRPDYSGGNAHYNVKAWVVARNVELSDAAALYYDFRTYEDASGAVDTVRLAAGEKLGNNPIFFDVLPGANNPFGNLYFPHRTKVAVKAGSDAYYFTYDTVTSLNIVHSFHSNLCMTAGPEAGTVVLYGDTDFYGNPDLDLNTPGWGQVERNQAWYITFSNLKTKFEALKATAEETAGFAEALRK
jgi:hypothetical protein